jgi:hypothetical protein
MNHQEHLLTIVAEEALEVAHRASKALRFGLMEIQPGQALNNAQRLIGEFHELIAALEMLNDESRMQMLMVDRAAVDAKKVKVEKFLAYSLEMGTLQP